MKNIILLLANVIALNTFHLTRRLTIRLDTRMPAVLATVLVLILYGWRGPFF